MTTEIVTVRVTYKITYSSPAGRARAICAVERLEEVRPARAEADSFSVEMQGTDDAELVPPCSGG